MAYEVKFKVRKCQEFFKAYKYLVVRIGSGELRYVQVSRLKCFVEIEKKNLCFRNMAARETPGFRGLQEVSDESDTEFTPLYDDDELE